MADADLPLKIQEFVDPFFAQNSRVMHLDGHDDCWLIDPGLPPTALKMIEYVRCNRLEPSALLLTHAHVDHIAGVPDILDAFAGIASHLAHVEWPFLSNPNENLSVMGGVEMSIEMPGVRDLCDGDTLMLGGSRWTVLETPGHSPGGRSWHCPELATVVVGDTLFLNGIGRHDFPHSDGTVLMNSIRQKLLTLPDHTRVLSGHGPETRIDIEKASNPFVGAQARPY